MKKVIIILSILVSAGASVSAQKYFTRTAHINFFSDTDVEDITADNNTASLVLDVATGQIEMSCTVKAFEFEKALMQEHFNENYMESDKFPTAKFKGKVENMSAINLKKDGTYKTKITGELTMHGVTKTITTDATFVVSGGKVTAESKFVVNPEDYNIMIPDVVKGQISKAIAITVQATLAELNK